MSNKKVTKKEISRVMSALGSIKSKRKSESSRRNVLKAHRATSSPEELLAKAYKAWKAGRISKSQAAVEIAKCRYSRFKAYCDKQDSVDVGI